VAALIPLTFSFFGIGEFQKVMFIFIACVAFIVDDTASAVWQIENRYIDTAYTLGANRRQIILKVIFPLALPSIFNSLRLLFGLAFGYIMLAELINSSESYGGLGYIINISLKRGLQSHIILVLLLIPIVAFGIDRILFWIQCELFPYRYGGSGILRRALGAYFVVWEEFKSLFYKKVDFESVSPDKNQTSGGPK
jgi:ABC-type nitrate/sulfonate/bicarbonate transport system permease component